MKVAVTVTSLFIVMVQVDVPAQVVHPAKAAPEAGVATRVTVVPGR